MIGRKKPDLLGKKKGNNYLPKKMGYIFSFEKKVVLNNFGWGEGLMVKKRFFLVGGGGEFRQRGGGGVG